MSGIITVIHIIVCFILIIAVLLQSGKAADLAGAFGGGGSQTVFGPRGAANILSRATTISAILFMTTSLGLWMLSVKGVTSAVKGEGAPTEEAATVTETKKETEEKKPPATEKKEQKNTETEKRK
ncbi:MAG: preprotein translocase subunit SecG [Candidatus Aminicenantes bacterium]|nr:MAG: preprotein translocase subunit SecG [Candidatus Aminicenantes bacterium]